MRSQRWSYQSDTPAGGNPRAESLETESDCRLCRVGGRPSRVLGIVGCKRVARCNLLWRIELRRDARLLALKLGASGDIRGSGDRVASGRWRIRHIGCKKRVTWRVIMGGGRSSPVATGISRLNRPDCRLGVLACSEPKQIGSRSSWSDMAGWRTALRIGSSGMLRMRRMPFRRRFCDCCVATVIPRPVTTCGSGELI